MNPGAVVLSRTGAAVAADFANATGAPIVGDTNTGRLYWLGAGGNAFQITKASIQGFGAVGGTADDSDEIALSFAGFGSTGGSLYVPHGTYRVGAMSLTLPIHLDGDGGVYTAFNPILAGASDDTLTISPTTTVDHAIQRIEGIALHDPTTGTRTGRYGIFADTQVVSKQLPKFTLRDTSIGQGSNATAWGFYHLNNATNNPNGGMYGALLENNAIKGGVRLENSGDSISVVHNILSGTKVGIFSALASGASMLEMQGNNITNADGAIQVFSGSRFRVLGNNCENSVAGAAANNDAALMDFTGTGGTMYGGVIKENLLSAFGATDATMLLRLRNCRGTLVEDNVFLSGAAGVTVGIDIGSDCQDVRIGANAYNAAITTKVTDAGVGTMGVIKTPALQNSWAAFSGTSATLKYIKSSDGMVHVYGAIKDGTFATGTLLATLATGFRPSEIIRSAVMALNVATPQIAEVSVETDGSIRINYALANTCVDINFTFPAANLADGTSLE